MKSRKMRNRFGIVVLLVALCAGFNFKKESEESNHVFQKVEQ